MRIAGQKVCVANASRTNFVFLKLYTDEGIEGVGEATLEWKKLAVVAPLEELERALIRRDESAVDATVEQLQSFTRADLVILDELGYLPFSATGGVLLFHLLRSSTSAPASPSPPISASANGPRSSATPR